MGRGAFLSPAAYGDTVDAEPAHSYRARLLALPKAVARSTFGCVTFGVRKLFHREDSRSYYVAAPPLEPTVLFQRETQEVPHLPPAQNTPQTLPTVQSTISTIVSGLSPSASDDTPPTTACSVESGADNNQNDAKAAPTEMELAIAGIQEATAILEQRHAAMKLPSQPAEEKKILTLDDIIRPKKPTNTKKTTAPNFGGRVFSLISQPPSSCHPQQAPTANEACDALLRRQHIRDLAYRAMGGCDSALDVMDRINDHFEALEVHRVKVPDLTLNFEGVHVRASQFGHVEHAWIARYNIGVKLLCLTERKQMSQDDYENVTASLFPSSPRDLLSPEYFEIVATDLGIEGIITPAEVKDLVRLVVTKEEFAAAANWVGSDRQPLADRNDANNLATLDIPKQAPGSHFVLSAQQSLLPHLRILVEAAAYQKSCWKRFFFANAQSKLASFYEAYTIQKSGYSTPPALTEYVRSWTYREVRTLERGMLVVQLLKAFEAGELTDYGIIRAVRGSLVPLPGHGAFGVDGLSKYLYHRVALSGLDVGRIPEILALHPQLDNDCYLPEDKVRVLSRLHEEREAFEEEEAVRLRDIQESVDAFEKEKMRALGRWGRMKLRAKKVLKRKDEVVAPFDPFAEEYGTARFEI